MKLQEQTDNLILGENFESEGKGPHWLKRLLTRSADMHLTWIQRGLVWGVVWLIACSTLYVGMLLGYAPAFRQVAGVENGLSAVRDVARTRQHIRGFEAEFVGNLDKVKTSLQQLAQLRSTQALGNNPTLLAVKTIRDTRTDWDMVLADIDGAIKKTVQSNDILQRIVIGSVTLSATPEQGAISKVKVYANGDQSSLALAAKFVQALEASNSLKEVKSSAPTTQQETASGAVLTYTPLDITFGIQREQEVTADDPDRDVKDVQKELQNFLPR